MSGTARTIATATLVAGTFDIISAFLFSERSPAQVLRSVASGPFGTKMNEGGWPASLLGLAVHFTIMAAMVSAFVWVVRSRPGLRAQPVVTGLAYGLLLYLFMYWVVLPLRWPSAFPVTDPTEIGKALFAHLLLVGVPIALIVSRGEPART